MCVPSSLNEDSYAQCSGGSRVRCLITRVNTAQGFQALSMSLLSISKICNGTTAPAIEMQGNCGKCEFRNLADGTSTGPNWTECLNIAFGVTNPDPGTLIFDLWDWRRKDDYLNQGVIYLQQMSDEDFEDVDKPTPGKGLERRQRQKNPS